MFIPVQRRTVKMVAAGTVLAWLSACGGGSGNDPAPSQQLTLEQKIGQMVMMGVDGTSVGAPGVQQALAQVRAGQLGGVVLYRYNITDPAQVRALNGALQQANPLEVPLLIALDQEGGLVQRLRASNGFADTPSPKQWPPRKPPSKPVPPTE